MSNAIITTTNLTKCYGDKKVVNDVTLQINQGEICGLVGKNGAGKTTLMRLLTGLISPSSGTFAVCPNQVRTDTTVAALIEAPSLYGGFSAMDNLKAQARLLGIADDTAYFAKTLEIVGLANTNQKVSNFSLGMKQRLAIAVALLGKPNLVLLDEPTRGIDVGAKYEIYQLILDLANKGKTVLMVSSEMPELLGVCDRIIVMSGGRVAGEVDARNTSQEEIMTLAAKYV